LKNRKLKT